MLILLTKIKNYYINYKKLKGIQITKDILQRIPNKELHHHQLLFLLYQLESHYYNRTHLPLITNTIKNLNPKYPRVTGLLLKYPYGIPLILYTLKGLVMLLIGLYLYRK